MGRSENLNPKAGTKPSDVILFVPNLIGYFRILLSTFALLFMSVSPSLWVLATGLYLISFVADLLDGWAARKYNQSSDYGGLLDMITDRCSTTGLLHVLSFEYSQIHNLNFRVLFLGLIILDISSHWCQMYASTKLQLHHKSSSANETRFFLVRWYYGYYYFFGYLCVGAEFTYIILYAMAHVENGSRLWSLLKLMLNCCLPGCAMKQVVNVCQGLSACWEVARHDARLKQEEQNKKTTS